MKSASLTSKLLWSGRLRLTSPMLIGTGAKDEASDLTVLKDQDGNPYLPATSVAGVLRHYFYTRADTAQADAKQISYFWGSGAGDNDQMCLSALVLKDLVLQGNFNIKVRDGVSIDHATGIAIDGKKYDYEVVEPGAVFDFKAEVSVREVFDKELFIKIIIFLAQALQGGKIHIGAMITKGLGRCVLENCNFYELDFTRKNDVIAWLSSEIDQFPVSWDAVPTFPVKANKFIIEADFAIKNSLIIRSYVGDPNAPDAAHIESNGQPVLPGTSVKGAVRSRARRIINILGLDGSQKDLIKQLMGWADDKGATGEKIKSRLIVEETPIANVVRETQNRIRIDRFTGGVQKTALFDSMPLWPDKSNREMVRIKMTINDYQDWEAGLLLLILKDLWVGDLPLGGEKNIGRGVIEGVRGRVLFSNGNQVTLERSAGQGVMLTGEAEKLEGFVQALVSTCQGGGRP